MEGRLLLRLDHVHDDEPFRKAPRDLLTDDPDRPRRDKRAEVASDAATIRMLGVAAAARGRGVGEALVRHCIAAANEAGCSRVRLDTRTSMASAQRLYERLGFEREPAYDWSPAPGISLLAYVLDLWTAWAKHRYSGNRHIGSSQTSAGTD